MKMSENIQHTQRRKEKYKWMVAETRNSPWLLEVQSWNCIPQHYCQFVRPRVLADIFPASFHKWKPDNLFFMHLWQFPMTKPPIHASYLSVCKSAILHTAYHVFRQWMPGWRFFFFFSNRMTTGTVSTIWKSNTGQWGNSQPEMR